MRVDKSKWQRKKLGDLCDIKRGGSPRPIQKFLTDDDKGINWIKIGDAGNSKYISSCKEKIIPEGVKKSRMVHKGDFLLSNSMSFGRPYILNVDGCIHDGWLVLEKPTAFDTSFLYYLLGSPSMYEKFAQKAQGAIVNNLNIERVAGVEVLCPSLDEQRGIAAELDAVQEMIDGYKAQLADLDTLAQSIFLDTFGKIGTPLVKLGDYVIDLEGGKSLASNVICKNKVLKTSATTSFYFKKEEYKYLPIEYTPNPTHLVNKGDLLISRMNTPLLVGACAYVWDVLENTYLPDRLWRIKLKDSINPIFLWYVLCSKQVRSQMISKARGTSGSMKNITKSSLRDILIISIPLALQEQFAEQVEAIERQKELLRQQIADAETLMAERMQYYFS